MLRGIKTDPRVVVPPLQGYDSGVHRIDHDKYLVVSTDPCIGVPEEWFGWLLVHYAASDVALFGAKPEFCTINLLGPPFTPPRTFLEAMNQTCNAANDLGMAIVTGHTGTYEGLSDTVGVCTAYGMTSEKDLITPGGAKSGDLVLCTKPVGLEVAVNFALVHNATAENLFGADQAKKLSKLVKTQSCVEEALLLGKKVGVHAMHDATEGGLVAALNEMTEASGVGFEIDYENIMVAKEAYALKDLFRLSDTQLLSMSSTGTIIAAISREVREEVTAALRQIGIKARVLGVFTENKKHVLIKKKRRSAFPEKADDPYDTILSGKV